MDEMLILWTKVYAVATWCTVAVLLGALIFAARQVRAMRHAQELQGFVQVADWLQREEIRAARRRIYELEYKDPKKWTNADKEEAGKVCHNFDVVGDMVEKRLINERVLDNWKWTIRRCWVIVKPMIEEHRKNRKFPGLWSKFQRLAEGVDKEEEEKNKKAK